MTMDTLCHEARELVPWVANDTASEAETLQVYRHIADCAGCRTDLAQTLALRHRTREAAAALPLEAPSWEDIAQAIEPKAPESEPGHAPVLRAITEAMQATGLPAVLSDLLSAAIDPGLARPVVSVDVPFVATVNLGR